MFLLNHLSSFCEFNFDLIFTGHIVVAKPGCRDDVRQGVTEGGLVLEQASDELSEVFREVLGGRRCLWLVFRMGRPKEVISVFYQKFEQGIRWDSLEEGGCPRHHDK